MTDDADRAAKALIAAFRLLADRLPGMHEKQVAPGVISLMSGLPVATLNGVLTASAHPDITDIDRAAASLRLLTENLNKTIVPLGPQLQASVRNADATLKQAQTTLNTLDMELRPDSPLLYQTSQTLSDVSEAAQAVRHLVDYLDRNPGAIIRGRDFQKGSK